MDGVSNDNSGMLGEPITFDVISKRARAPKARNMKARGKREARRPWLR